MTGSRPIAAFSALFRTEHRVLRDLILDLIEALRAGNHPQARRLVGQRADMAVPHLRYEEERKYPALVEFFELVHVESLCVEHDSAIGAARPLCELVGGASWGEAQRVETEELARGLRPHVSVCERLSILVERPSESEVARILPRAAPRMGGEPRSAHPGRRGPSAPLARGGRHGHERAALTTAQVVAGVELLDFGVKDGEGASCRLRLSRAAA